MNHLSEEQLVLHYYGETAEEHLETCDLCRAAYQNLQRVLNSVDSLPVPERGADYENHVWNKLEPHLGKSRPARWFGWKPLAIAASVAVLIAGAFFAGEARRQPRGPVDASQVRERLLLVAVGDHLERSQTVLVELSNAGAPADGPLDISYEQQTAEDLLESNRLYRQTAVSSGDAATAALLEDLERVLLEVAHSPSEVSAQQLEDLRKQIEDRGILFKVKVFGSQMEQREAAPPATKGNRNKS
jgi:hypothetical protein